jgi:hypothetical protein
MDRTLVDRYGFGLLHLLEVALRYSDWSTTALSASWPGNGLPCDEPDPPSEDVKARIHRISTADALLSDAELVAFAVSRAEGPVWIGECGDTDRCNQAWLWATTDRLDLRWVLGIDEPVFGSTLAVRNGSDVIPVPASLALSAVCAATKQLLASIADDGPFDIIVRKGTATITSNILGKSLSDPDSDDFDDATWIAQRDVLGFAMSDRRTVLITFAAGLTQDQLLNSIDSVSEDLASFDVEARLGPSSDGDQRIVTRLVVYGGPLVLGPRFGTQPILLHCEQFLDLIAEARQFAHDHEEPDLLWWQFLEELATMPGVAELVALDLDEVWRHWLSFGVINLGGITDLTVLLLPEPGEAAWERWARWEPFCDILQRAGLPPPDMFPVATLDPETPEAVLTDGFVHWTVSSAPMILIGAELTTEQTPLAVSETPAGIADGILLTLRRSDLLSQALRLPDERVPVLLVRVLEDEPDSPDLDEGVAIEPMNSTHPAAILTLSGKWMQLLATAPVRAHEIVGNVLIDWIITGLDTHIPRASLKSAWCSAPPVMMVRPIVGSLSPRAKGTINPPRSIASRGRAIRRLARALVASEEEPPTISSGRRAIELSLNTLIPTAQRVLAELVGTWRADSLRDVVECMNDAFAERHRREVELENALSAPWASNWKREALNDLDKSEPTRSMDLLVETCLTIEMTGTQIPDSFDIAEAAELADILFQLGMATAGALRGLHDLLITVTNDGVVRVTPAPSDDLGAYFGLIPEKPLEFDVASWQRTLRAQYFASKTTEHIFDSDDLSSWSERNEGRSEAFTSLASLPVLPTLLKADQKMRSEIGTGIDGIAALLGTAIAMGDFGDRCKLVTTGQLVTESQEWSGLNQTELDAALTLLTLSGRELAEEALPFWEQNRRRFRLTTRPLIALTDDSLLIAPWRVHSSQQVFRNYLMDGSLPWIRQQVPERVDDAFNEFRKRLNSDLERMAEAEAKAVGPNIRARRNVVPEDAAEFGLTLNGEIDLLVGDLVNRRVWICEVKDLTPGFSAASLRLRIKRFAGRDGFIDHLIARKLEVELQLGAVFQMLGLADDHRLWDVEPLMLTRRPEPAAFIPEVPVTFATVGQFAGVLASTDVPEHGHVPFDME